MRPTPVVEESMVEARKDESRREALTKFGRYAAVAPVAMALLSPRGGQAEGKAKAKAKGQGEDY